MKPTAVELQVALTDRVIFHPLVFHEEAGDVLVGVREGQFLSVSRTGALVIQLLREGHSVGSVRKRVEQELGTADFTIVQLLESLLAAGAVQAIGSRTLPAPGAPRKGVPFRAATGHVAWLFSPLALAVYLLLAVIGALSLAHARWPFLAVSELFAQTKYSTLVILGFLIGMLNAVKHELAHALAAAYLGVDSRLTFGYRFLFPVLQTEFTGLWAVPRNRRFVVYLAGMASDLLTLAALAILAVAVRAYASPATASGALTILTLSFFVILSQVAWQFNCFVRTDLYFVLASLLNCRNLHADAKTWLRRFGRPLSQRVEPRVALKIKLYGGAVAAGYVLSALAVLATVIELVRTLLRSSSVVAPGLRVHFDNGDKAAMAGTILLGFLIVGWAKRREMGAGKVIYQIRASGAI